MSLALTDTGDLAAAFRSALRPSPNISVADWSDEHRVLDSRTSSEPGPWRTSVTPYLQEIMEVMSPSHPAQRVTFMKSSRTGGTEVLNNVVGAYSHLAPCPIMVVQPTLSDIDEWSKDSLSPMVEMSSVLTERYAKVRSRSSGNTLRHKQFLGGAVFGVGAATPTGFRRRTARLVLCDEIDGWPGVVGDEGDPLTLAENRAATYPFNKKILRISTPTVAGSSRIDKCFGESDQRYFHVPCPSCGTMQQLRWQQIRWPEGKPEEAIYLCENEACGLEITERRKSRMLKWGRWVVANPGGSHPGFHISQLYSPWVTWVELAQKWVEIQGNKPELQVFVNTRLGEVWHEYAAELTTHDLMDRRERWWPEDGERVVVPAGANALTAGVDTQDNRLEAAIWAWGAKKECWLVDYVVLYGDPADDDIWHRLDQVLDAVYAHATYEGGLRISAACIDAGGHHTQDVYRYTRTRTAQRRWATLGRAGEGRPIWPREGRLRKQTGGRSTYFIVGVDPAKAWVSAMVREDEPRRMHFPAASWCDLQFFNELTAEQLRVKYKRGQPVRYWWKPDGAANEALDTAVLALAAMTALESQGVDPGKPLDIATRTPPPSKDDQRQTYLGAGRGSWLRR